MATLADLRKLPKDQQREWLDSLTDEEAQALLYDWSFLARDKQRIPDELLDGSKRIWLILAGRGFGKTRTGVEAVRTLVEDYGYRWVAMVGRTAADVRDVMITGESGLLRCMPPWNQASYEPSKRQVTFQNGAIAKTYSADKPDQMRGPQSDLAVGDELAAWRYAESYDQLAFGNRLETADGRPPLRIFMTTPRPTKLIRQLVNDPRVVVTVGSTMENLANLSADAVADLFAKYEGTRLGRQELYAQILDDTPGALWTRDLLERNRLRHDDDLPDFVRSAVAIDPANTAHEDSDETGIIAGGLGGDGHAYITDDISMKASPETWAAAAIRLYDLRESDAIVVESNNGGDMIESTIRLTAAAMVERGERDSSYVNVVQVRASRGKYTRAEPISAIYEQGRAHHVGMFAELEDQQCTWVPGADSPDRLDAAVWLLTWLMVREERRGKVHKGNPFMRRR